MSGSWSFSQFHQYVSQGKIDSFYGFLGDESYLVDQSLRLLKAKILLEGTEEFNFNSYYSDELEIDDLKNTFETLPMMSDRRLIIIRDAHNLKSDQLEKLAELTSIPNESSTLALVFEKVDQRKKVYKDILKNISVIDVTSPKERDVPGWILQISKSYGKIIDSQSVMVLHQLVGNRLIDLDNEIRKLSLFVGDKDSIQIPDIEAVVSKSKLDSVFELTEAMGAGKTELALKNLKNLLEQGQSEIGLLAMLTRHVRLLLFTKEGMVQKLNSSSLSSYVGVPPFFMNQYTNQATKWTDQKIKNTYSLLLKTDRSLKSVSIKSQTLLENLIIRASK